MVALMLRSAHVFRRFHLHPALRILLALLFFWDTLHVLSIYDAQTAARHAPPPPRNTKRIFIAAQFWNNADLLRARWNAALVDLVKELGIDNVHVAIYESGSFDETKDALRELDSTLEQLSVKRRITLSDVTHKDEIENHPAGSGWVDLPSGEKALRRIPFLADVRNKILDTLRELHGQGHSFDTVLFLNDVVFQVGRSSNVLKHSS